jgi:hypothetical protein
MREEVIQEQIEGALAEKILFDALLHPSSIAPSAHIQKYYDFLGEAFGSTIDRAATNETIDSFLRLVNLRTSAVNAKRTARYSLMLNFVTAVIIPWQAVLVIFMPNIEKFAILQTISGTVAGLIVFLGLPAILLVLFFLIGRRQE